MLNIIEREIVWKYYAFQRVARLMTRGSAFAKTESSGTDLSGKWDQTILNASDVNAYQDATNILAFSTTQSKATLFKMWMATPCLTYAVLKACLLVTTLMLF